MSSFYFAQSGEHDVKQDQSGIVYISDGVEIHGVELMSNTKIETLPKASYPKKTAEKSSDSKYIPIAKQILKKKNEDHQKLKALQHKIDQKIAGNLYTSKKDNDLFILVGSTAGFCAVSSNTNPFNFSNATLEDCFDLQNFKIQLGKQKFATSLSFLQFRKLRSSSLRAPPEISLKINFLLYQSVIH